MKIDDKVTVCCTCCGSYWKGRIGKVVSIDAVSGRIGARFGFEVSYFDANELTPVSPVALSV